MPKAMFGTAGNPHSEYLSFLEYIVSYACIWDVVSVGVSTAN